MGENLTEREKKKHQIKTEKKKKKTARIPLVTKVVSVSVHGYFAQSNALGKPDSGGQIVYVLDSVRALEKELNSRIEAALGPAPPPPPPKASAAASSSSASSSSEEASHHHPPPPHPRARVLILTRLIPEALDTSCDARLERVAGTEAAAILRVPFRSSESSSESGGDGRSGGDGGRGAKKKILRKFVSRFQVWPFLEDFAIDAVGEILEELEGHPPDLILGNYSDGNLVATLLSRRFSEGGGGEGDGGGEGKDDGSSSNSTGGGGGAPPPPLPPHLHRRHSRRRHGPTQCSIAHALESNKYRDSLARWREYGPRYNFETMFTSVRIVFFLIFSLSDWQKKTHSSSSSKKKKKKKTFLRT